MNINLNELFNPNKDLDEKSTMALLRALVGSHNSGFDYPPALRGFQSRERFSWKCSD